MVSTYPGDFYRTIWRSSSVTESSGTVVFSSVRDNGNTDDTETFNVTNVDDLLEHELSIKDEKVRLANMRDHRRMDGKDQ